MWALLLLSTAPLLTSWTVAQSQQMYLDLKHRVTSCLAMKHKMPPFISGNNVVDMLFHPYQITSVDEIKQSVKITAMVAFCWSYWDCGWNVANYSGINFVPLNKEDIWYPEIVAHKNSDEKILDMPNRATISSEGTLMVQYPVVYETACYLNLLHYPFDEHNCSMHFMETDGMALQSGMFIPVLADLGHYLTTSAEWILLEHGCGPFINVENITYTECWFTMKRRSTFYMFTVVFPVGAMCTTTLLVFCIPAESGEKMSFLISLFVAMTVFINFVVQVIPRSMDRLPKLVWLIIAVMFVIGAVTTATAFILKRYHQELEGEQEREYASRKKKKKVFGMNPSGCFACADVTNKTRPDYLCPVVSCHVKEHFKPPEISGECHGDAPATEDIPSNDKIDFEALFEHGQKHNGDINAKTTQDGDEQKYLFTRKSWRNFYLLSHTELDNICFVFFLFISGVALISIWIY